ncbi:MAG: hypothetical protein ACI9K2_006852 [Myxococcota bacterium]|jgi:hypothetical protein
MWMVLIALLGCKDKADDSGATDDGVSVDCDAIAVDYPSARSELSGVWDPKKRRMVMFGGDVGMPVQCIPAPNFVDETWAFYPDCGSFEEVVTGDAPRKRGRHVSAYDAVGNRMIIHGGRFRAESSGLYTLFDDTWALDLATDTWSKLSSGGPGARTNHAGVAGNGTFYVMGGNASEDGGFFQPLDDTWALDLATGEWTELATKNNPEARLFHAGALSPDGGTLYAYGGGDEGAFLGPFFGDLWALDLASLKWSRLHNGNGKAPLARIWPNLIALDDRLVLWAGHDDGSLGNTNEVWAFDLASASWERQHKGDEQTNDAFGFCDFPADFTEPDTSLPERRNAGVAVATDDGQMILFGGKTDCGIINDAWSMSLTDYSFTMHVRATAGEICLRAYQECSSMCAP